MSPRQNRVHSLAESRVGIQAERRARARRSLVSGFAGVFRPRPLGRRGWRVALPVAIAGGVFVPTSALATSLVEIPAQSWQTGTPALNAPVAGYVSMWEYAPSNLPASPPILVAAHYCGGSAASMMTYPVGMASIVSAATTYGFIMIFPQTTNPATSADCWDVGSTASLTRYAGGDTQAIVDMVQYEIKTRNANANRVYAMGASSGAMMTEALMALYPDIFKAGAEISGVPAGCWSDGWTAASNWSNACATGDNTMTAEAWGDLVRGMFPGYTGYRPRLQLWHDTMDPTINYTNQTQAILEWTNVLGLSATPTSTSMNTEPNPDDGGTIPTTVETWQNSCNFTVLEAHNEMANLHANPADATAILDFLGLNKTGDTDPEVLACDGGTGETAAGADAGTTQSGSSSGNSVAGTSSSSESASSGASSGSSSTSAASSGGASTSSAAGSTQQQGSSAGPGGGGSGGCAIEATDARDRRSLPAFLLAAVAGLAVSRRRRRRD